MFLYCQHIPQKRGKMEIVRRKREKEDERKMWFCGGSSKVLIAEYIYLSDLETVATYFGESGTIKI